MIVAGVGLLQEEQQSDDSLDTAAMATRSPASLYSVVTMMWGDRSS